jgi:hypothetical protein
METHDVQTLKGAIAISQTWTRRHNQAAVLMALPLVVSFVMVSLFPSAVSTFAIVVASATALTVGICLIPEDFRSRRGSLITGLLLVLAMWAIAVMVALACMVTSR